LERLSRYCDLIYELQAKKMRKFGRVCGCAFTSLASELSTQDEKIRQKSQQILDRRCRYFAAALRDAVREGLIPEQDCDNKARELFGCVMGVLVEAKIENDLEIIRHLKPTIFQLIGVGKRQIAGEAAAHAKA